MPIPPNPVRVGGRVKISLFGLTIGEIDLRLLITAVDQVIAVVDREADETLELEALSRNELYELARAREVVGRSRMNRRQLLDVLTPAGRSVED